MLLEINDLYFSYSKEKPLFESLSLSFEKDRIIALAGESGCGKSTLLSLIYGLLDWQKGEIIFDGRSLMGPKGNLVPGEPDMKFVAQHFDLMPYATVAENVGKFISNINLKKKKETVTELLEVVGLEDFAHTLPKYLSGGQQQRVAIARALSVTPKLLVLDEPFSNLDFSRKIGLREKLFRYVKQHHISLIISTHELQDIIPWLDQIVVLENGKTVQNGSPEEIFRNPESPYVAELFGEVNIFSGKEMAEYGLQKFAYYPGDIKITGSGHEAEVLESRFAGSHYWNKIRMGDKELIVYSDGKINGAVTLTFS